MKVGNFRRIDRKNGIHKKILFHYLKKRRRRRNEEESI